MLLWLAGSWALTVALFDVKWRRIPNQLLALAVALGFVTLLVRGQGPFGAGWVDSIAGALICGAIWWPGYRWAKLGAGDVKLAACIGFLLGILRGVEAMLYAAVMLGVLSAAALAMQYRGRLPAGVALATGFAVAMSGHFLALR